MSLSYNPKQYIMSRKTMADEVSEQISKWANSENLPDGPVICAGISREAAKVLSLEHVCSPTMHCGRETRQLHTQKQRGHKGRCGIVRGEERANRVRKWSEAAIHVIGKHGGGERRKRSSRREGRPELRSLTLRCEDAWMKTIPHHHHPISFTNLKEKKSVKEKIKS